MPVGVVPGFVEDAGSWAAAFAAVAGAGMLIARAAKSAVERAVAPELETIKHAVTQLSAENTAQHVANANAAAVRDRELSDRIDNLTGELRAAGDRFERRIVVIEETVADHIGNRLAHQG